MATDNGASTNLNDDERQRMRLNILRSISDSNFGSGFGAAFNIDPEDKWDLLYTRRKAEGKASIPPRAIQTVQPTPIGRQPQATGDDHREPSYSKHALRCGSQNTLTMGCSPIGSTSLPSMRHF